MNGVIKKLANKSLRQTRVRSRVSGTAERPRLSVFISNRNVGAQIIDDTNQVTLVSATTVTSKTVTGSLSEKAAWVGTEVAKKAQKAGIRKVVFDRGSRQYKNRLRALADAARKEGLEF